MRLSELKRQIDLATFREGNPEVVGGPVFGGLFEVVGVATARAGQLLVLQLEPSVTEDPLQHRKASR